MLKSFFRNEAGATAIEYALVATLISILIVGSVTSIGTKISTKFFQPIANNLN